MLMVRFLELDCIFFGVWEIHGGSLLHFVKLSLFLLFQYSLYHQVLELDNDHNQLGQRPCFKFLPIGHTSILILWLVIPFHGRN